MKTIILNEKNTEATIGLLNSFFTRKRNNSGQHNYGKNIYKRRNKKKPKKSHSSDLENFSYLLANNGWDQEELICIDAEPGHDELEISSEYVLSLFKGDMIMFNHIEIHIIQNTKSVKGVLGKISHTFTEVRK